MKDPVSIDETEHQLGLEKADAARKAALSDVIEDIKQHPDFFVSSFDPYDIAMHLISHFATQDAAAGVSASRFLSAEVEGALEDLVSRRLGGL